MDQLTFLQGGDSASFEIINGTDESVNGRNFAIRTLEALEPGTYNFTCSVHYDNFDYISSSVEHEFTIAKDYGVYCYALDFAGVVGSISLVSDLSSYNSYMFDQYTTTPVKNTSTYHNSVLGKLASGSLGQTTITGSGLNSSIFGSGTELITGSLLFSGSLRTASNFTSSFKEVQPA